MCNRSALSKLSTGLFSEVRPCYYFNENDDFN